MDISFIENESALKFINVLSKRTVPKQEAPLSNLPVDDPQLQDLLSGMLEFNPYMRCCAREIIDHPYFIDVKTKEPETFKLKSVPLLEQPDVNLEHLDSMQRPGLKGILFNTV